MPAYRTIEGASASPGDLSALAARVIAGGRLAALTGAGISTASGIPDFRSPGGLWDRFDPMEYGTLACFLSEPSKAWELFRALGAKIAGARPNVAHRALARLEAAGRIDGIVTQNVDGLHRKAGSRAVIEIHGEASHLQCLGCGRLDPLLPEHLLAGPVPTCGGCGRVLKPNVVLFEEEVRGLDAALELASGCDVLLVVGTSAEVAPASILPEAVVGRGGSLVEFNLGPTRLTSAGLGPEGVLVAGPTDRTVPAFVDAVLGVDRTGSER